MIMRVLRIKYTKEHVNFAGSGLVLSTPLIIDESAIRMAPNAAHIK